MHMRFHRERALIPRRPQHIQRHTRDQVDLWIRADFIGASAFAFIGDAAVELLGRAGNALVHGDAEFEVEREGQADDVEAWADVGGGAGNAEGEGGRHFFLVVLRKVGLPMLLLLGAFVGWELRGQ